jgi:hypothetical protein
MHHLTMLIVGVRAPYPAACSRDFIRTMKYERVLAIRSTCLKKSRAVVICFGRDVFGKGPYFHYDNVGVRVSFPLFYIYKHIRLYYYDIMLYCVLLYHSINSVIVVIIIEGHGGDTVHLEAHISCKCKYILLLLWAYYYCYIILYCSAAVHAILCTQWSINVSLQLGQRVSRNLVQL